MPKQFIGESVRLTSDMDHNNLSHYLVTIAIQKALLSAVVFCQQLYISECDPQIARVIFKARTRMFDVKANFKTKYQGILHCPFCKIDEESLEHILHVQMV